MQEIYENAKRLVSEERIQDAIKLYEEIVRTAVQPAQIYIELAEAYKAIGCQEDARTNYLRALSLDNKNTNARFGAAILLEESQEYYLAICAYRAILGDDTGAVAVRLRLANACSGYGIEDEARSHFEILLNNDPHNIDYYICYANSESNFGNLSRSRDILEKAMQVNSGVFAVMYNLANTYQGLGDLDKAIELHRRAVKINPRHAGSYNNLGNIYKGLGQFSEALAHFKRGLKRNPDDSVIYSNIGATYSDAGEIDLAIDAYEKSLRINPDNSDAFSNYLYSLNYPNDIDEKVIYEKHLEWSERFSLKKVGSAVSKSKKSNSKTRVGYLSGDFRRHSVAYFFEPLIANHDKSDYEIFCYHNSHTVDDVTLRLQSHADRWRDVKNISDPQLLEIIEQDNLDILVDLSGHTNGNRMLVFRQELDPVTVSWLGYPNTTGAVGMDYRFTDAVCDPIGLSDDLHSERLVRLDNGFLCYQGDKNIECGNKAPRADNGYVTFGSFNNITKMNGDVIRVWSELMGPIEDSRLVIKSRLFSDSYVRAEFLKKFNNNGIGSERLELIEHVASYEEHMKCYSKVDVALDTFPYNGTTTTCEALWMGVPVVTINRNNHRGRVTKSILNSCGIDGLDFDSESAFISNVSLLANDVDKLDFYRANLRKIMLNSTFCDDRLFARAIENAYKNILVVD